MLESKITKIEAIALLLIIMANKIILNLPQTTLLTTGSAAWINTLYIVIIAFLFLLICLKLLKKFNGLDILDISKFVGGKVLLYFVAIFQIILLFYVANTIIRNFSYTVKTIYFNRTPIIFIASFMIVACSFACKHGIKAISKVCLYILPLAYVGLIILLFAPAKDFEIQRLFPILGYGIKETFVSRAIKFVRFIWARLRIFIATTIK